MTASDLAIRPVGLDERAAWEPLWNGYLTFYELSVTKDVSDVLWKRLHDPAEPPRISSAPIAAAG